MLDQASATEMLSVVKTWLQLIFRKNYINDNYTKCV